MNKYYFKLVLIVLGILSFNIDMLNANAKSATCVYQDGANCDVENLTSE